jgi:hypothetical protein
MKEEIRKNSEFKTHCTFKPTSKSPTRTHQEFIQETEVWSIKKNQKLQKLREKQNEAEILSTTLKPSLSLKTLNLTSERSLTPVFKRLSEAKSKQSEEIFSFHPSISPLSSKLMKNREGVIFDRLYSKAVS